MGRMINVEKAQFTNQNISIYAQNKIGQYSKFLDKNPIFITYFHINQQLSRADVGTGGIQKEIGQGSPVRYNMLTNFPVYNIPELKPDTNFDESGFDIDLDINDITILPNTIKPNAGDYFVISFPGIKQYLFRVNNFRYNTIQSNDFYMIDAEIKDIQDDCIALVKPQVVEVYQTVFENIGTQDKCFLNNTEIDKINTLVRTFETIRDMYYNYYYEKLCNSFVYRDNCNAYKWLYDPYLEAFINKAQIFYENNIENALVLTPADILDPRFDYIFSRTLYNAVLNRSLREFSQWEYYYRSDICKRFSPYVINHIPAESVKVVISNQELPYDEGGVADLCPNFNQKSVTKLPTCTDISKLGNTPYFSKALLSAIASEDPTGLEKLELIIYNYLQFVPDDIDLDDLYGAIDLTSTQSYYYVPIVLYIITQYYNEYFKNHTPYQI